MQNVNTLLFDLGGVLIELGPVAEMMATSPQDSDTIWKNWIRSTSVSKFESGRCSELDFAEGMVSEFELTISADEFLAKFKAWPRGTFKGAPELLLQLSGQFRLVCLSNTNPTHYEHFLKQQAILEMFDATFFSHITGVLKPEPAAFENVLNQMDVSANQVLFFDDHPGNVRAARKLGLFAEQVNAPSDVLDRLNGLGLADD